jgi:heat shock protein HtpX
MFISAAVIGFMGSFFSLAISKWMAKRAYKMTFITNENLSELDSKERVVWDVVYDLSERNHIKMPEVGIYEDKDPNAFATGPSKNNSLVAVSTGLLTVMEKDAIE